MPLYFFVFACDYHQIKTSGVWDNNYNFGRRVGGGEAGSKGKVIFAHRSVSALYICFGNALITIIL